MEFVYNRFFNMEGYQNKKIITLDMLSQSSIPIFIAQL